MKSWELHETEIFKLADVMIDAFEPKLLVQSKVGPWWRKSPLKDNVTHAIKIML